MFSIVKFAHVLHLGTTRLVAFKQNRFLKLGCARLLVFKNVKILKLRRTTAKTKIYVHLVVPPGGGIWWLHLSTTNTHV